MRDGALASLSDCACVFEKADCTCALRRRRRRHQKTTSVPPRQESMLRERFPDFRLCLLMCGDGDSLVCFPYAWDTRR